jgi:hypothetical protein
MRALEKRPEARFQSAREMLAAIDDALAGTAAPARSTPRATEPLPAAVRIEEPTAEAQEDSEHATVFVPLSNQAPAGERTEPLEERLAEPTSAAPRHPLLPRLSTPWSVWAAVTLAIVAFLIGLGGFTWQMLRSRH